MIKIQTRLVMVPVVLFVICLLIGCSRATSASPGSPWFRSAEQAAKGRNVNILAGKVFDPKITSMTVKGNNEAQELSVMGHSRFFFMVHQSPFSELEVTPGSAEGAAKMEERKEPIDR
ncbi:hypothetical protein [Paenibacillus cellulositrophicus]|uniref:hypothetical protein n=1 Tax=Paenibacillus cellulositrophicus TaxID=562959 RepID=UPI003D97B426